LVLTAIFYETKDIIKYLIPLSVLGALTSILHYAEQIQARLAPNSDPFVKCTLGEINCADSYIFQYGYITIPLMTLTAFLMIIIVTRIMQSKHGIKDGTRQLLG
jgi:disulfide bond formation protein DsbB